ncbi:hypothetical protein BS47DRAFT_1388541, partial [Hydnum rufescens UP504]
MVAGSPHPFGTAADKKEVSTPSEHKCGHHSPAWKRTYVSMCQNMGDPSWLGQMMGMFDVAFKNAFCGDQGVMKDFLTKLKQYLEVFHEYMSEVQEIIWRQITAQGLGVEYQNACVRLEWLLRHWPYGDEIPVPLLSNTMLEWMEERMKPRDDPGNMSNPRVFPGRLPGHPGKHGESSCIPGSSQEDDPGKHVKSSCFPGSSLGTTREFRHLANTPTQRPRSGICPPPSSDTILQDPLITRRIHDATEAVSPLLPFLPASHLPPAGRRLSPLQLLRRPRRPHPVLSAPSMNAPERDPPLPSSNLSLPLVSARGKAKAKAVDAEESYPFFGSLDPPVHEEVIDRAWSSLKAAWDDSKTALRSSDDTEKRMVAVTAIPDTKDRHFVDHYRPALLKTIGGATIRHELQLLVALYTDQRTFPFWDSLDPSPPDSSSLLSPLRSTASAPSSPTSPKFTHLNFDPKTNLSGGIKNALRFSPLERQRRALYPGTRQKSSSAPSSTDRMYPGFLLLASPVSTPLPPPPPPPPSSPPPQSRPAPSSSRPRRPSVRIQSKPFINQDDDSDNDDQSDDDDKGATTTDAPSEGFDLEHPEGDNDDDATDEDVPHPPLLPPQSQSDQDDDEDDPNLRTPIPLQRSSQPRSAHRIDSPCPSPSPVPSRNSPHILVPDSQPPRLSLGPTHTPRERKNWPMSGV